jgi:hypothetical protein
MLRSQGFAADEDTWESTKLSKEIIEEFEEAQELAAKRRKKPPRAPPVPYTRAIADAESEEVRRRPAAPPPLDAPPAKPSPAVYDLPGE